MLSEDINTYLRVYQEIRGYPLISEINRYSRIGDIRANGNNLKEKMDDRHRKKYMDVVCF